MKWLYKIAIALGRVVLLLGGLFLPKIRHFSKGRKQLFERLQKYRSQNSGNLAWFHVASLGEYEQARPVIAQWKSKFPEYQIVVSFFSPSGYDHVVKKPQPNVDFITYIPIDSRANAVNFLGLLKPTVAFFVKYDLWYHHIEEIKKMGVPLYLFSASFRADQVYFKRDGFFRSILFQFDHIFTQNKQTVELLKAIHYQPVSLAGDTRFDRVSETALNPKTFPDLEKWSSKGPVLVAGSVWQEDMDLLIPLINSQDGYKWIIVPHDLDPEPMKLWAERLKAKSEKYSEWDKETVPSILFIDNIGMLSSLYQYARMAYVGGAFGKGLHNILEPMGFGVPVIFGDLQKVSKFPEASESQVYGCGFSVKNEQELQAVFEKLKQEQAYQAARSATESWVNSNLGAAQKIINEVQRLLTKE
ncbi:3-deoxy-D-manno-octulosonic acid transferase [Algoriphagus halophytocola]|uniref:3-deoxy-D-manno-octulosonic acid transferase n=1 Tax=Algoriphagus halophytocola TaxID=2991499 RepID=A0ABY6MED2_9BACT|nr:MULTISPECIES: glycosyltransferase N-terminal domain-containing protein [unclassified Algoriphagus]UZD20971.1 3-deoxy-D-manno-octulosonic acid transferase [Algoriphagus sp. TR-M5]WBL42137.1 3-deoxy-D-manno-octulosonic acid transferase [Algoriphagus sp. TR-M9]